MKSNYATRCFQHGLSLIELLVALSIGSFLIIGAVTMQSQTRRTFDVNEQQARVQENARYVIAVIEPELQLAGLCGYSQDPNTVMWDYSGSLTPAADLRMDSAAAPGLPEGLKTCGDNFAVDVLATVTAVNGTDDEEEFPLTCDAEGGGQQVGTDLLVLRHSAPTVVEPSVAKLQVYSERLAAQSNTRLFVADVAPGIVEEDQADVRDMVVQAYYISKDSEGREGVPALRMKMLSSESGAPVIIDQEVLRGVEDLQVQFGVDPGDDLDGDGTGDDPSGDGMADFVNGYATQYVNPGDTLLDSAQVVAVRIWVRVRGDQPETGFKNEKTYDYADTTFTADDNFRRIILSRTIYLRNSRQQ